MKAITILFFIVKVMSLLLISAWNIIAFLSEVLVNDEDSNTGIGNHLTTGGNDMGDDSDFIKRAGNHYVSDRDKALYDRTQSY